MTRPSSPRIYTRTGDAGDTGLFDGTRTTKADARIDACGDVDELSACLGMARVHLVGQQDMVDLLDVVQRTLLAVGAILANPSKRHPERSQKAVVDPGHVQALEGQIDRLEEELPPLRRFILAGGSPAGATLHLSRAVCRRAERKVVGLGREAVDPIVVIYLNRLSDLLFVMARAANVRAGAPELEW